MCQKNSEIGLKLKLKMYYVFVICYLIVWFTRNLPKDSRVDKQMKYNYKSSPVPYPETRISTAHVQTRLFVVAQFIRHVSATETLRLQQRPVFSLERCNFFSLVEDLSLQS